MARGPEWIDHVDQLRQEMERLMEHFSTRKPPAIHFSPHVWEPHVDVVEADEHVIVIVDLAGLTREDIELSVMPDALTLRGERRDAVPQGDHRYHQMEIPRGKFQRVITLPSFVSPDDSTATIDDGLLRVTMPKQVQAPASHEFKVRITP